jgi:phosphoglycolate phosphatase
MAAHGTLLFDLDGTLVDSAVAIAAALSELAVGRGGVPVSVAHVRKLVSRGVRVLVGESLGAFAAGAEEDIDAFRAALQSVPVDRADVYPGAIACLDLLVGAGYRCAIVTNKPEGLSRLLLEQLDLTRFFGAVIGGDTLECAKPDAGPLLFAVEQLGARAESAVMIGDSAVDAQAARAAGMPFVLFERGYDAASCADEDVYARFAAFGDLPAVLTAIR